MHAVFVLAINWDYFDINPVKHIKLHKHAPLPKQYLMPDQIALVINESFRQNDLLMALVIQLAFIRSLRKGEIAGLGWDAIDFEKASVFIDRELTRVHKSSLNALSHIKVYQRFPSFKHYPETVAVLKEPKTHSSIRTVFMPRSVISIFNLWKIEQKRYKKAYPNDFIDYNRVNKHPNNIENDILGCAFLF